MLPRNYNPKEIEPKWQQKWEELGVYRFDVKSDKPIYSIDTPPPTVSGQMHLGHAFSYSQMDFIARFRRMQGYNLFYPFGTDDNGLPTERLVEKLNNVKARDMKRDDFVNLCLTTLEKIRPEFVADWKRIGISVDWTLNYSTIDEHCRRISQRSFIELYRMGREYRKRTPFIWCPNCETAIAQVELEDREVESSFNDIIFRLEDGGEVVIGTTRPELLPACVAIFAHPEDNRYKELFGKRAQVPLFGQLVEIRPDPRVDPEKGTGIVMCCTFGDMQDIEWYMEHNLPLKVAITKDGRMTRLAGKYKGLSVKEARERIIEELRNEGLLVRSRKITHVVNVHERCGTEIEILNTKQWFIRYLDMKEALRDAGRRIRWHPEHMRSRYENWIAGLRWDWCISRQRYFGVPFPVWYCKACGEIILAREEDLPVDPLIDPPPAPCPSCGSEEYVPERDVLDTWATSSLTPILAAELVEDEKVRSKLYPMSLRPQAHDIITFWLFNTVVKGLLHRGEIPWYNAMISGWALDPQGKKMSKSKGNVIEPQYVLQKYSADALRLWAAESKLGEDLPFKEKDLVTAQRFLNKLWNASRFTLAHLQDYHGERPDKLNLIDAWILSKAHRLVEKCTSYFEEYRYSKAKKAVVNFFLSQFCDNYLEMVKARLYNPEKYGEAARRSAQYALYKVLLLALKLLAPFAPHITEEIYQSYYASREPQRSIHVDTWPKPRRDLIHPALEKEASYVVTLVAAVRRFKAERGMALNAPLKALTISAPAPIAEALKRGVDTIEGTLQVEKIEITSELLQAKERILELVPNFATLGPEFKGDAGRVAAYMRTSAEIVVEDIAERGIHRFSLDGKSYELRREHIKEVRKEISLAGARVESVTIPELPDVVVLAEI
ncbi:valine--tRNA ligase [Candidatus Pyrohabitans sp.]